MNKEMSGVLDIVEIIKRRVAIIAISTLVVTISTGIINWFVIKPTYKSNTELFVGKNYKDHKVDLTDNIGNDALETQGNQSFVEDMKDIITDTSFIERALNEAQLYITVEDVLSGLTVAIQEKSNIVQMTFKANNAYDSQKVLKALNEEFIKTSKTLSIKGSVEVVNEPRIPVSPSSPNKVLNVVISFFIGAIVGTILALLVEYLKNSQEKNKLMSKTVKRTIAINGI